jgi:hypothetical protein
MRQTNTLDPNHKYWDCRKPTGGGETCNTSNEVHLKECRLCDYKIDGSIRVMAVNENRQIIGELHSYDAQSGEMVWEYED